MDAIEKEAFYDSEIAPKLMELCRLCQDRGLSFLATVEWAQGDDGRGHTMRMDPEASLPMLMIYSQIRSGENIDAHVISILKHAQKNEIDFTASIVMAKMTGKWP